MVTTEEEEKILAEGAAFVESVAKELKQKAPRVMRVSLPMNRALPRPRYRGAFFPDELVIGIDLFNFPFRSGADIEKTMRHEISEWLEFVLTGLTPHREAHSHAEGPFRAIHKVVSKDYPGAPAKVAAGVERLSKKVRR